MNDFTITTDINRVKAGECGAIEVILGAMKIYTSNADICENGCMTLRSLAMNGKPNKQQ